MANGFYGLEERAEGSAIFVAAVEGNGCLRFEGCAEGAPVMRCEFNGGHMPGPGSEQASWDFFSQF